MLKLLNQIIPKALKNKFNLIRKKKSKHLMLESFKINYMAEKGLKEIKNHNDF